jgi:PBP1b-binding outer membrane lipoprotein LpoB
MKPSIYSFVIISAVFLAGCGNAQSVETVSLSDAPASKPVWLTDLEKATET